MATTLCPCCGRGITPANLARHLGSARCVLDEAASIMAACDALPLTPWGLMIVRRFAIKVWEVPVGYHCGTYRTAHYAPAWAVYITQRYNYSQEACELALTVALAQPTVALAIPALVRINERGHWETLHSYIVGSVRAA